MLKEPLITESMNVPFAGVIVQLMTYTSLTLSWPSGPVIGLDFDLQNYFDQQDIQ